MCVLIFSTRCVWNISHYKNNAVKHRKCTFVFIWSTPYSYNALKKVEVLQQILKKCSNIKFHETPSSESRVVPCGRKDRGKNGHIEGQTDMTNIIVAFRNFSNAPENDFTESSLPSWSSKHESCEEKSAGFPRQKPSCYRFSAYKLYIHIPKTNTILMKSRNWEWLKCSIFFSA